MHLSVHCIYISIQQFVMKKAIQTKIVSYDTETWHYGICFILLYIMCNMYGSMNINVHMFGKRDSWFCSEDHLHKKRIIW